MTSVQFEYELDYEGRIINCMVEAEGHCYNDPQWGADADGNRGVSLDFVEDVEVKIYDSRANDITTKLKNKSQSIIDCFEEVACEKLLEAFNE